MSEVSFKEFLAESEGKEVVKEDYQGWTNYATWRIALEFGFMDSPADYVDYDADGLESYVDDMLEVDCENQTTLSYARAFINDVNWHEIEQSIKDAYNEEYGDQEEE